MSKKETSHTLKEKKIEERLKAVIYEEFVGKQEVGRVTHQPLRN